MSKVSMSVENTKARQNRHRGPRVQASFTHIRRRYSSRPDGAVRGLFCRNMGRLGAVGTYMCSGSMSCGPI